jgi:predicted subunit of tRNA(5-methylaminomethyl-2-thiouridylate) methyltransferase
VALRTIILYTSPVSGLGSINIKQLTNNLVKIQSETKVE